MQARVFRPKELASSEKIERHFRGKRFSLFRELKELEYHASLLPKLLLAGKCTGLELLTFDADLQERITKAKNRLRMSSNDESVAQRQRRKEGSAWV